MKKVLLVVGLMVSMSGFAQSVAWVIKPRTHDTIGYVNLKQNEFVITREVTQLEFDKILATYGDMFDIGFMDKGYVSKLNTPEGMIVQSTPIQLHTTDTTSRGTYLVLAGQYKNAAIAVGTGTSIIVGAILTNPSTTVNEYNSKAVFAGILSAIGGAVSFGLNIAGNNMLIKAGLVTQK